MMLVPQCSMASTEWNMSFLFTTCKLYVLIVYIQHRCVQRQYNAVAAVQLAASWIPLNRMYVYFLFMMCKLCALIMYIVSIVYYIQQ